MTKAAAREHFRTPLLTTPFHERTSALVETKDWAPWSGYTVANVYRDLELEYSAIRNSATLFDLTPMIKYRIEGPDAERYLNRLTVRNVAKLRPGRVQYTLWCDDDGKVLDDGTLFRLGPNELRLCSQERHLPWLHAAAFGYDVSIEDVSEDIVGLALQGPTSFAVLKEAGLDDAGGLRSFAMQNLAFGAAGDVMISRTGFTGDLGYELWTTPDKSLALWDQLWQAGQQHGIMAIGSAALNMARIEAGFAMTNSDFVAAEQAVRANRRRSPHEIGLGWLVDFEKGHFNGRRALVAEQENGTARWCLVGLDIDGNKPAEQSLVYHSKRKEIGHVTAAMWSPTCKRNIALACLKRPYGETAVDDLWVDIYVARELEWHRLMERAQVVERPFFNPPRRRATPPALF